MKSRKMVLIPYLQGNSGDTDTENRLVDTVRKEREGGIERVTWKHILYHMSNR